MLLNIHFVYKKLPASKVFNRRGAIEVVGPRQIPLYLVSELSLLSPDVHVEHNVFGTENSQKEEPLRGLWGV